MEAISINNGNLQERFFNCCYYIKIWPHLWSGHEREHLTIRFGFSEWMTLWTNRTSFKWNEGALPSVGLGLPPLNYNCLVKMPWPWTLFIFTLTLRNEFQSLNWCSGLQYKSIDHEQANKSFFFCFFAFLLEGIFNEDCGRVEYT